MTSGMLRTASSKAASSLCFLAVQPDVHEYVAGQPHLGLAHERGVAIDHAGFFERADPPQAGGLGQADQAGELHVADAAVLLQGVEDQSVVLVQLHSGILRRKKNRRQKMPYLRAFVSNIASKCRDFRAIVCG